MLLRTGFVGAVTRLTKEEQVQLASAGHVKAAGVKQGDDVLAWLWDSKLVSLSRQTACVGITLTSSLKTSRLPLEPIL